MRHFNRIYPKPPVSVFKKISCYCPFKVSWCKTVLNKSWYLNTNATLKRVNKVAVISNFLAFFPFLVDKFTLLDLDRNADPDPGGKMNADLCGSGSTALQH